MDWKANSNVQNYIWISWEHFIFHTFSQYEKFMFYSLPFSSIETFGLFPMYYSSFLLNHRNNWAWKTAYNVLRNFVHMIVVRYMPIKFHADMLENIKMLYILQTSDHFLSFRINHNSGWYISVSSLIKIKKLKTSILHISKTRNKIAQQLESKQYSCYKYAFLSGFATAKCLDKPILVTSRRQIILTE